MQTRDKDRHGLTTTAAIAREVKVGENTVRAIEQRAMLKFARELERRGIRVQDLLPG